MSEIVNERDVQLQATQDRLAVVTMQPNMQVSQDQIAGLGITLLASKSVSLRINSQAFVVGADASITPAVITITPVLKNLRNPPQYTILTGEATLTVAADGTASIAGASMLSSTLQLNVKVTEDGRDYIDEVTLVKLETLSDAVTAVLSNEMETLPADSLNNVTNYVGAVGNFRLFDGSADVAARATYSIAPGGLPVGVTALISPTGAYKVTALPQDGDSAQVVFRATYHNVNYDLPFTLRKARTLLRGSMTFYIPVESNVWSDTVATAAVNENGGLSLNDVVTQYWVSGKWAETRFWSGSAWQPIAAVVDGNMLVEGAVGAREVAAESITAYHVAAESIDASRIDSRGLSIRDPDGNVILSAGVPLDYQHVVGGPTADSLATLTLITATTDTTVTGNEAERTAGGPAWDTGVRSAESYAGGAYASAIAATADKGMAFGLNTDPASANDADSIDFAFVLLSDGTIQIKENGVLATTTTSAEAPPDSGGGGGSTPPANYVGVLDTVGVSAAAAYSTRRLRGAYTGAALRVRRSTDNQQTDIGFFTDGSLDVTAMSNFAGGLQSNLFVVKWYDQSGNGRDLISNTTSQQPRIYLGGAIDKIGTRPALRSLGSMRMASAAFTVPTPWTRFYVTRLDNVSEPTLYPTLICNLSSTVEQATYLHAGFFGMHGPSGSDALIKTGVADGAVAQVTEVWKSVGAYGRWNGVQGIASNLGAATNNGLMIFSRDTSLDNTKAALGELILLDNEPSSSIITAMEANQKTYWGTP